MKNLIKIALLQIVLAFTFVGSAFGYECGEEFTFRAGDSLSGSCSCEATGNMPTLMNIEADTAQYCCGFIYDNGCHAEEKVNTYTCGETFSVSVHDGSLDGIACDCSSVDNTASTMGGNQSYIYYCCGFVDGAECRNTNVYECGETKKSESASGAICNCEGTDWQSYKDGFLLLDRGLCCGWVGGTVIENNKCLSANPEETEAYCGDTYEAGTKTCNCGGSGGVVNMDNGEVCCGWVRDGECRSTDTSIGDLEITKELLDNLNPLSRSTVTDDNLKTPGGIISRALKGFIFPIAGLILFVTLLLGGFQMLTGATSKGMEEGKQKITSAIIGFIILFAAYWIAQLLELIFGIRILS